MPDICRERLLPLLKALSALEEFMAPHFIQITPCLLSKYGKLKVFSLYSFLGTCFNIYIHIYFSVMI